MDPLKIGPAGCFGTLRGFLTDSYYTETAVCQRLGLKDREDYLKLQPNPSSPHPIRDRLDLLARLFLIGEFVDGKELQTWGPANVLEAIHSLGLVARHEQSDEWFATAALYPVCGVYVVSDRWSSPELAPIASAVDVVYPAITPNTTQFLDTLPEDPCEDLLDLCSGTGIGALTAASRYARHAWATDILERATRCAEFSRLLSGIENVTVARGDLYEVVEGRTFDRITANPPYMPSLKPAEIYADGGELGDRVVRRIVEGLPKYLRPGGRFYCITAGPDQQGEEFEQRVRRWLGDAAGEFDIFLFERKLFDTNQIANQQTVKTRGGPNEVERWKAMFEKNRVEHLFYGSVMIQRKTGTRPPVTLRRRKGSRLTSAEIEWLRSWETEASGPDRLRLILDSKPIASKDLELHVVHRVREGEMAPQSFRLETNYPFTVECAIQPWAAFLLARCDGKSTARELLAFLKENGLVDQQDREESFAEFLRVLISGGFLEVEGFRLPPH